MELFQEIIACVFLLASGLLMLIRPDVVWKIEHYFIVQKGEPTDWYLTIVRIIGLIFVFIAIVGTCIFLVF